MARIPVQDLKRRYLRGIREGLDEIAAEFLGEANGIIQAESIDTAKLLRSGHIEKTSDRERAIIWDAPHASPVHYGSRPHWPPLDPIVAWVRRNLQRVTLYGGENRDIIRPGERLAERGRRPPQSAILRVAHAVRAKIAKEGTPAVAWVPRAWSRVKPKSAATLQRAINEALE